MAKKIKQFRFYGNQNASNYPSTIVDPGASQSRQVIKNDYLDGDIFANYYPIVQLGIQALPGTKFFLNDSQEPVIVGYTGIYELDLSGNITITKLTFDADSLDKIEQLNNGILLVDIIYENTEAEG